MEIDLAAQIANDLNAIKERISTLNQSDLTDHSDAFEEIHTLLQQALSNLDGV
jgi:hypothetical protein